MEKYHLRKRVKYYIVADVSLFLYIHFFICSFSCFNGNFFVSFLDFLLCFLYYSISLFFYILLLHFSLVYCCEYFLTYLFFFDLNPFLIANSNTLSDIHDCLPNPCENGGTCTDRINSYTCSCAAGYTGSKCQTSKLRTHILGIELFCLQ